MSSMVVLFALFGLLLFAGYAGVTGRFAADSRDPDFSLFAPRREPLQDHVRHAVPVVRVEVPVQPSEPATAEQPGTGLMRELAG